VPKEARKPTVKPIRKNFLDHKTRRSLNIEQNYIPSIANKIRNTALPLYLLINKYASIPKTSF
jgi:hypothetical protein